ncbi:blastomere cadherin-like isoform X2 [Bufo gargarizans]|uniref:blastomere cadherin-like isoform X2 n=1 Tax=Bufo gargarizans TaxID=30331 RepID=UPI001CF25217|nr:blastomere cadherin-like isoform X2 [Bufo gargarizans]
MRLACLALLVVLGSLVVSEEQCKPGFNEQRYAFAVTRKFLERNRIIGKVSFTSCSANNRALFSPDDTRFRVFPDGKVTVKRQLTLHGGSVSFVLNAWDANGMRHSVPIFVWNEREEQSEHGHHHSHRRHKRDWMIPPINILENQRGPYPIKVAEIKSSRADEMTVFYSITGQGADTPPVGLFTIEKSTGWLYITKPLDREEIPSYKILVHAVSGSGAAVEAPIEIDITVMDQNDNRPRFTQPVFEGTVAEGSKPGTPVMTVSAMDPDDTVYSNNGVIQYSITDQTPQEPGKKMFRIDPTSGLISVDKSGLSYEQSKKYVLTVTATDEDGQGFSTTATAVISVLQADGDMSGGSDSLLSTHVLNTAQGIPAKGLTITLSKLDAGQARWVQVSRSVTNEDGRCPGLLRGEPLTAGTFQLRFDTKDYWKQMQQDSFYPYVEVVFTITDPKQKYHVPLLLTQFSYTTYRGS